MLPRGLQGSPEELGWGCLQAESPSRANLRAGGIVVLNPGSLWEAQVQSDRTDPSGIRAQGHQQWVAAGHWSSVPSSGLLAPPLRRLGG